MDPAALAMSDAQAIPADAGDAVIEQHVKTSRNNSRRARNYFVPPPPPNTPSIVVLSAMGMRNGRAATSDDELAEKAVNSFYSKYSFTRNQGDIPQVVRPNPYVSYNLGVEKKVLKEIENFDSEISNHEKEIGKLLNL